MSSTCTVSTYAIYAAGEVIGTISAALLATMYAVELDCYCGMEGFEIRVQGEGVLV